MSRSHAERSIGDALRDLGFNEVQAVEDWRWFSLHPTKSLARLVVQLLVGRSAVDLSARVQVVREVRGHWIWGDAEPEFFGRVETFDDVVALVGPTMRRRFEWSARAMVTERDPRVERFPSLVAAVDRAPTRTDEWAATKVLTDALLDAGVDF